MHRRLIIFGASGDLTFRFLVPALARLAERNLLPEGFEVLGMAREDWSEERFRQRVEEALAMHLRGEVAAAQALRQRVRLGWRRADVTRAEEVRAALGPGGEPVVAYLALPPGVFAPLVRALKGAGLPEGSRLVVEKPFGESLASARELNRLLAATLPESQVYRMDHFLGIQTAQNILGLRFGNRLFEPVWNHQHIRRVDITWDETLALEERAGYYDRAGALRDMLQNHLLQLLCLVAMEPPLSLGERDLRDRKVDVLRAVVAPRGPEAALRGTVRARYTRGTVGGRQVPGYAEEGGVDASRGTETFAQVRLHVQNWRWAGVPFVLRSGKALGRDRAEIVMHLRPVPLQAFCPPGSGANQLRLTFEPEGLVLRLNVTSPHSVEHLRPLEVRADFEVSKLQAYGRLLLEVLEGSPTFFIRGDEAEESWRIVEPVLEAWDAGQVPLEEYPAGSDGPARAHALDGD
jgi:glucose-6-phosphate 1-dehydrogenase